MSLFELIHAAMHASYKEEMEEQDLEVAERKAADEELRSGSVIRAHTLEQLAKTVNVSQDEVRQVMKRDEGQFMHYPVNPANGGAARNTLAVYGLKEHRAGQPGWQPGVDF